ncbi:hypothetical protein CFE70_009008, partial [Pyrenophora teres f. teres 0-1]
MDVKVGVTESGEDKEARSDYGAVGRGTWRGTWRGVYIGEMGRLAVVGVVADAESMKEQVLKMDPTFFFMPKMDWEMRNKTVLG